MRAQVKTQCVRCCLQVTGIFQVTDEEGYSVFYGQSLQSNEYVSILFFTEFTQLNLFK